MSKKLNIAVFGANGAIASKFIEHALQEGHTLNLYARKNTSFAGKNGVQTYIGELSKFEAINDAIKNTDAVVSFLGPALKYSYPGTPIEDGHRNIVKSMKANGIRRFITIATPSVKFSKDKKSIITTVPTIMAKLFMPKPYKEIVAAGELTKNSGLDWTIIRFLAPVNGPATNKVKVSFGDVKMKFKITREDVAIFTLNELTANKFIQSMPIIGS